MVSMMFVDFVALLPPPPPPPPPPGILSFRADIAPLSPQPPPDPPSAIAEPPEMAALPSGLPSATPSSLSVRPETRSLTVLIARPPRSFISPEDAPLRPAMGSTSDFAIPGHLPDPERADVDFFVAFLA